MKFYCTAGRGTEQFCKEELVSVFGSTLTEVLVSDGKVFFCIERATGNISIRQQLLSLKTVERVFVCLIHKCCEILGTRELLTLLHTDLSNKNIWEDFVLSWLHLGSSRTILDESRLGHYKETDSSDYTGEPPIKRKLTNNSSCRTKRSLTFRVSCRFTGSVRYKLNIQKSSKQMGILISKSSGWKVELHNPEIEVCIHLSDSLLTVGVPISSSPLSKREYIKHFGLRTTVAAIMFNMLDIQCADTVLDPMCGKATILIEAAHSFKDAMYIGIDKDKCQLNLAIENVAFCRPNPPIYFVQSDTMHIPLASSSVDKVLTDAPFGLKYNVATDLTKFYINMLLEVARVVKPHGKIVLLTSSDMKSFLCKIMSNTIDSNVTAIDGQLLNVKNECAQGYSYKPELVSNSYSGVDHDNNSTNDSKNHGNSINDSKDHGNSINDSKDHGNSINDSKDHGNSINDSKDHGNTINDSNDHDNSINDSKDHGNSTNNTKMEIEVIDISPEIWYPPQINCVNTYAKKVGEIRRHLLIHETFYIKLGETDAHICIMYNSD